VGVTLNVFLHLHMTCVLAATSGLVQQYSADDRCQCCGRFQCTSNVVHLWEVIGCKDAK